MSHKMILFHENFYETNLKKQIAGSIVLDVEDKLFKIQIKKSIRKDEKIIIDGVDLLIHKAYFDISFFYILEQLIGKTRVLYGIYKNRLLVEKIYNLFGKVEIHFYEEKEDSFVPNLQYFIGGLRSIERQVEILSSKKMNIYYLGNSIYERRLLGKKIPVNHFLSLKNHALWKVSSPYVVLIPSRFGYMKEEICARVGNKKGDLYFFEEITFKKIWSFSTISKLMYEQINIFKLYWGLC